MGKVFEVEMAIDPIDIEATLNAVLQRVVDANVEGQLGLIQFTIDIDSAKVKLIFK